MLFIKSFNNYDEFKNIFGIVEHGNGVKSRKNKILLAQYKNKELWKFCREIGNYYPFTLSTMSDLKMWIHEVLRASSKGRALSILGHSYMSEEYILDDFNGVCEDADESAIRYVRQDNNKVYKMKIGRFIGKLINEHPRKEILCEEICTWFREEITQQWIAERLSEADRYRLYVSSEKADFEYIYSSEEMDGDFHSCMTDCGYENFYTNCVDASAAYLMDEESGCLVARCVIFNNVTDQDGKRYRLAERQYASNERNKLKCILVSRLIEEGYIDGYKQIGAGCHDNRAFVAVSGESLMDKKFKISCDIDVELDYVSYQDSFVYYDPTHKMAYNYHPGIETIGLNVTGGEIHTEYDSWHDCYCVETREVFHNGCPYDCNVDDLEDFVYVPSADEYHYADDVIYIERYDAYYLQEDVVMDEETGADELLDECIKYNGKFYYKGNCVECASCGLSVPISCAVQTGEEWMCKECSEGLEEQTGQAV